VALISNHYRIADVAIILGNLVFLLFSSAVIVSVGGKRMSRLTHHEGLRQESVRRWHGHRRVLEGRSGDAHDLRTAAVFTPVACCGCFA